MTNSFAKDSFLQNIIQMHSKTNFPVAIISNDFSVIWASEATVLIHPCLKFPDGFRSLIQEFNLEEIKEKIHQTGSFTACLQDTILVSYSIVIYSFPETENGYMVQFSDLQAQGSGMHPLGASRALSSFSHQYRSPITSIFSTLSLLSKKFHSQPGEKDNNQSLEYLKIINQSAYQLLRNNQWISTYTRLSSGLCPLKLRRVDLSCYLMDLFKSSQELIGDVGIPLTFDIPEKSFSVVCDTEKLSTSIFNILSNSCRFTQPDNHIHVRVRYRYEQVTILISDSGLGIAPEIQPHVFEPYFSYDPNGGSFAGTGLGLSIVQSCIAAMGGNVTLSSTLKKGTTVAFTFPITDNSVVPSAVFCETSDYLADRFSPLRIALSDSIPCPL